MELRDIKRAAESLFQDGAAKTAKRAANRLKSGGAGDYAAFIRKREPSERELAIQRETEFLWSPLISFICPVHRAKRAHARALFESLVAQTYSNWELVAACPDDDVRLFAGFAAKDRRVRVVHVGENRGIAMNTAAAADAAHGELLAFLDQDDTLAPFACFELVKAANDDPEADMFYSDEDKFDELGRFDPHFKPDWSPDTLLSYNYITHLMAVSRTLYDKVGGMRSGFDGSQDHDLALRASEAARGVRHIPKVLYHWRAHKGSVAKRGGAKPYAHSAGVRAVDEAVKRQGGVCAADGVFKYSYRPRWGVIGKPTVSVIIPNRNGAELLRPCINSLKATADLQVDIIIVDNGTTEPSAEKYYAFLNRSGTARVVRTGREFNYSAANNLGALLAKGELLLFLNNDVRAMGTGWLTAMAEQAQRPCVGAVGAKLLYGDYSVQHAGVVVGLFGWADHICSGAPKDGGGRYACSHLIDAARNVSAVTGACLMCEREKFEGIGGFDERFKLCGGDVELCLRFLDSGYRNVYTPYAELLHLESVTRKSSPIPQGDFNASREAYSRFADTGDPYYNRSLDYESKFPRIRT